MACLNLCARLVNRLPIPVLLHPCRPVPALTIILSKFTNATYTGQRYVSGKDVYCLSHCNRTQVRQLSTNEPICEADSLQYLRSVGVDCQYMDKTNPEELETVQSQAETLVAYFEHFGFTMTEVNTILKYHSHLLTKDMDEIQKRFEMFKTLGLERESIVKTITVNKLLMTTELVVIEKHIRNMRILMGASSSWICSMLKYKPIVFTLPNPSVTGANITMVKDLLYEHGSSYPENVLRQIMRNDYRLFKISKEQVLSTVDYLGSKGIDGTNLINVIRKCANIFQMTPADLEKRLGTLAKRLSLNEIEVKKFILYFPRAWGMNEKNLNRHIDFVYSKGFTSAEIVRHPYILWMSVDTLGKRYTEQDEAGLFATQEKRNAAIPRLFMNESSFRYTMDRILAKEKKKKAVSDSVSKEDESVIS